MAVRWNKKGTLVSPRNPTGSSFEDMVIGDHIDDALSSEHTSVDTATTSSTSNNVDTLTNSLTSSESDGGNDHELNSLFQ